MKAKFKQSGLTLTETVVVVASIAILIILGLPAVRALTRSFQSQAGTRSMISAALASARAIAAKEQHYAGVRFQHAYNPDDPCSLKSPQYIIFIVHDFDKTGLEDGFRAVEGIEPIKLPGSVGVMEVVDRDREIDSDKKVTDKTTFSIVFSPSGKLVIHEVRTRNKEGYNNGSEYDDIFNTDSYIERGIGMFLQDYSENFGNHPREELSKNSFRIYDKTQFEKVDKNNRYDDYLRNLDTIYINPYTGRMISK